MKKFAILAGLLSLTACTFDIDMGDSDKEDYVFDGGNGNHGNNNGGNGNNNGGNHGGNGNNPNAPDYNDKFTEGPTSDKYPSYNEKQWDIFHSFQTRIVKNQDEIMEYYNARMDDGDDGYWWAAINLEKMRETWNKMLDVADNPESLLVFFDFNAQMFDIPAALKLFMTPEELADYAGVIDNATPEQLLEIFERIGVHSRADWDRRAAELNFPIARYIDVSDINFRIAASDAWDNSNRVMKIVTDKNNGTIIGIKDTNWDYAPDGEAFTGTRTKFTNEWGGTQYSDKFVSSGWGYGIKFPDGEYLDVWSPDKELTDSQVRDAAMDKFNAIMSRECGSDTACRDKYAWYSDYIKNVSGDGIDRAQYNIEQSIESQASQYFFRYANFGFLKKEMSFVKEGGVTTAEYYDVYAGGYRDFEIDPKSMSGEMDFYGGAILAVNSTDTNTNKEYSTTAQSTCATLKFFNKGNEKLHMEFEDFYTIDINSADRTISFSNGNKVPDEFRFNYAHDRSAKLDGDYNDQASGSFQIQYFGDDEVTEGAGTFGYHELGDKTGRDIDMRGGFVVSHSNQN